MTKEIAWDLTGMFPSTTDKSLETTRKDLLGRAEKLVKKYQGKIADFSAKDLLTFLQELEAFQVDYNEYQLFCRLSFSANMTLPDTQALFDVANKFGTKIGKMLAFINLDVGKLVFDHPEFITDPVLANYKHYLEKLQRRVPHLLTEIEEQIIIEKDQFGVRAWQQLQSKWLNTRKFEVEVEGKKKVLSYGEANGLLSHPDRATRASANQVIYGDLGKDGEIYSSALRNIANDWTNVVTRRKYDSPMHASLIANDVEQEVIDNLVKTIEEHAVLYQRYLKLKAKIMGLPKLGNHDIVAPLPDAPDIKYDFSTARKQVIAAYEKFDKDYAFATRDMFEKNHIDASPRFGKRNGAFCASWFKGKSAYMLQSFSDTLDDTFTLAHELGHATHDYYFEREQTILNARMPMVVAETASIMGELLLTDLLLSQSKSDNEKKTILCAVLDGAGMAAFQVSARIWFEQSLYDAIERGEFLDHPTISKYWTAARDKIYGDAVEWFPEMEAEWMMKVHYFMPNFRFYNYPYVYAQMFVYALYQKYQEEGAAFVPKFKEVLAAGGSVSPKEIGEMLGLDITDPDFWKLGMKQFERFIDELEKLVE